MVGERHVERYGLKFAKLTPYDRLELARKFWDQRRATLLKNLKDAQCSREEILGELDKFDSHPATFADFYNAFYTAQTQIDILVKALGGGTDAESKVRELVMSAEDQFKLVSDIAGVKMEEPQKPADESPDIQIAGDDPALDPNPPTYGDPNPKKPAA